MLSGNNVMAKLNEIESNAITQVYLSLILCFVKIPKANNPNKGPYVNVANLNKFPTTFPSRLLNKITTNINRIETPICTFLRKGFCAALGLFSMLKKSTENEVVKELNVL